MIDRETRIDKSIACLQLGAIGDALGAPVEFMSHEAIVNKYGELGLRHLESAYGQLGPITDDTQMTLANADGLITAYKRGADRGILGSYDNYTALSYIRWYQTQNRTNPNYTDLDWWGSSELYEIMSQQGQRAPGNTCLSSLHSMKSPYEPAQNNSKGCGTVMRVAPTGIFHGNLHDALDDQSLRFIFNEASADAAITHGGETAKHGSGLLAAIIALSLHGEDTVSAVERATSMFPVGSRMPYDIYKRAIDLVDDQPSVDKLQSLGEGWLAEEALAISIYCGMLCSKQILNVSDALSLAINHNGDSDSTGAITGNIIGIEQGSSSIPKEFLDPNSEVGELMPLIADYGRNLITVKEYQPHS